VSFPEDAKHIGSKWKQRVKTNSEKKFERFQLRLEAMSFGQVKGVDNQEAFSPLLFNVLML
jgi:hypothetical protein